MALIAILIAPALTACASDSFIPKITISNPTRYDAGVEVAGRTGGGWLPLVTVPPGSQVQAEEVFDQGSAWVFRFSYFDYHQELTISRAQLAHDGWRVVVPASFGTQLKQRGVTAPPS